MRPSLPLLLHALCCFIFCHRAGLRQAEAGGVALKLHSSIERLLDSASRVLQARMQQLRLPEQSRLLPKAARQAGIVAPEPVSTASACRSMKNAQKLWAERKHIDKVSGQLIHEVTTARNLPRTSSLLARLATSPRLIIKCISRCDPHALMVAPKVTMFCCMPLQKAPHELSRNITRSAPQCLLG